MDQSNPENTESRTMLSINLDENSESLKLPKDIYLRILSKAVGQTQQDIVDIETALPKDDFERIQSISHRLKGDYDNMRITGLAVVARRMNEITKTDRNKDTLLELFNEFKLLFEQFEQFMNQHNQTE